MLPLGLNILLGEVEMPTRAEHTPRRGKATASDWLKLNGLTREIVLSQLTLIEQVYVDDFDRSKVGSHLGLSADAAWALSAASMRAVFPSLAAEIDRVETETPKCLLPKRMKHSKPFTYDLGFQKLPFVSLHYKDRPADLLAMAHELGHAVQIAASWESGEGIMPPVARESCAFMGELAMLQHCQDRFPFLLSAHDADGSNYFGDRTRELELAVQDCKAPYQYGWNYPLARIAAERLILDPGQADRLFKAGKRGGKVFVELITGSSEAEVAA